MRDLTRSQFDIILAIFTTISIVFVDRVTKLFFSDLLNFGESLPIIRNVLHMTMVHNTGIAFGFFKDKGITFIVIPLVTYLSTHRSPEWGDFRPPRTLLIGILLKYGRNRPKPS